MRPLRVLAAWYGAGRMGWSTLARVLRRHLDPDVAVIELIEDVRTDPDDFDVIVTEGGLGVRLIERLRSSGVRTPVVFLSGFEGSFAEARRVGAEETLLLPLDVERLTAAIERLTGRSPRRAGPTQPAEPA